MGCRIDLFADLLQVQRHGPCVSLGHHPCCADAACGTDCTKNIGPGVALIARLAGATATLSPDTCQRSLLTDACFILPPDFDGLVTHGLREAGSDQVGEVFLCASWAEASCPGC